MNQDIFKSENKNAVLEIEIAALENELKIIDFKVCTQMSEEKREMYMAKRSLLEHELERRILKLTPINSSDIRVNDSIPFDTYPKAKVYQQKRPKFSDLNPV